MNHFTRPSFWERYADLPAYIRKKADKQFERMKQDPGHPSLHLKNVRRFWSVRVDKNYRAAAVRNGDDFVWFWIGTHAEYNRLIR